MTRKFLTDHFTCAKGVKIDGNYIEFVKNSDLSFQALPNFTLGELLTKNTKNTFTRLSIDVLIMLDKVRSEWGSPLYVSSSYRSPSYNKSVGGATSSQHAKGNALDIHPAPSEIKAFQAFIKSRNLNGGVGYYNTFLHIDVGSKRTWDERTKK